MKLKTTLLAAAVTLVVAIPAAASAMNLPAPKPGPHHDTSTVSCSSELGYLPRVYASEVKAIDDDRRVWVTELCVGDDMMRSDGNAGAVRKAIASNDVLVEALAMKDFSANEVIAVRMMGDDTINLYVHRFAR